MNPKISELWMERHQQRHIARDDLRKHSQYNADLRSSALISQQVGQDFFSNWKDSYLIVFSFGKSKGKADKFLCVLNDTFRI
jgi:hypothetical protein